MIHTNLGHKKISKNVKDRYLCAYTVYDNKTDLPVIVDGNSRECAQAMGMKFSSFRSAVTRCRQGSNKRWSVLTRFVDSEDFEKYEY